MTQYLEKLYDDDVAEKVKGAQQILHLARALPSNLEILVQHGTWTDDHIHGLHTSPMPTYYPALNTEYALNSHRRVIVVWFPCLLSEGVMGALSRTLREEYKKRSMDLTTNLMCIFYCFSNFRQMHTFVAHHRYATTRLCSIVLRAAPRLCSIVAPRRSQTVLGCAPRRSQTVVVAVLVMIAQLIHVLVAMAASASEIFH